MSAETPERKERASICRNDDGYIDLVIPPHMTAEFCRLITRGMNTWEQGSFELRDLVDRLLRTGIYIPQYKELEAVIDKAFDQIEIGKMVQVPVDRTNYTPTFMRYCCSNCKQFTDSSESIVYCEVCGTLLNSGIPN